MKDGSSIISVSLKDIYADVGSYAAKLLIRPNVSSDVDEVMITMRDSDGKSMPIRFRRWGTKINVEFDITPDVPDGVATIDIKLVTKDDELLERFDCWVIK